MTDQTMKAQLTQDEKMAVFRQILGGELFSGEIQAAIDWAFETEVSSAEALTHTMILAEASARYIERQAANADTAEGVGAVENDKALQDEPPIRNILEPQLQRMHERFHEACAQLESRDRQIAELREALDKIAGIGNCETYSALIARQALTKHTGNDGGVTEPVMVSLRACIWAARGQMESSASSTTNMVKSILDTAGVKYYDD